MSTPEGSFFGWTEEELQARLPDELIPDEFFDNPLHAKLAANWWTNEGLDIDDMEKSLEPAFDSLTVEQKLKLASLIEEACIEDHCGEHTIGVWHAPRQLEVDEDEVVRGIVGSLHDIKEATLHSDAVAEWLLEDLVDAIYTAGFKWKGEGFQVSVGDENDRRYMLKQKRAEEEARLSPVQGQTVTFES